MNHDSTAPAFATALEHPADAVAIRMARYLADAGYKVQLWLHNDGLEEVWRVTAIKATDQYSFGFTVRFMDRVIDPEGCADYHARFMETVLNGGSD